jgi:NTE family protein
MFWKHRHREISQFTLALGGGGARGLAHIGVLKALEKVGLVPSLIVGTSMGALVGGMYSQTCSAKMVEEKIRTFLQGDFFKKIGLEQFSSTDSKDSGSVWERFAAHLRQRYFFSKSVLGTGMFAQTTLLHSLHMLLEEKDIRDLPIHFAAVASDLATGEEFIFTSDSIITAVAASSAVPGVVAPIVVGSRFLTDGTVTSTIPVPAARSLSKNPIIAVDVRRSLGRFENHRHGYEIVMHASEITSQKLNDIHLQRADMILKPDVSDIDWNEFRYVDRCIKAGEQAVEEKLRIIQDKLKKRAFRLIPWL